MSGCSARSSSTWAGRSTAGIYEPGHPTADERRLPRRRARADARARRHARALPRRQLRLRLRLGGRRRAARARPTRLDLAWRSIEPNEVGTDEFMAWARARRARSRCSPSTSARAASTRRATWSSTATRPTGSRYADWRAENGHADPYGVQALVPGQRDGRPVAGRAEDGGRVRPAGGRGRQGDAARRPVDRARASCGSSNSAMPTFGALGGHGARPRLGRRRLRLAAHLLRPARSTPDLDAYLRLLARPRPHDRHGRRDRRRGGRPQAQPQAARRSASTSGTSGTRQANPHHTDVTRAVQARAGAGRGRPDGGRRARRRLPADHAAAPRRPRARSAAWRSSST